MMLSLPSNGYHGSSLDCSRGLFAVFCHSVIQSVWLARHLAKNYHYEYPIYQSFHIATTQENTTIFCTPLYFECCDVAAVAGVVVVVAHQEILLHHQILILVFNDDMSVSFVVVIVSVVTDVVVVVVVVVVAYQKGSSSPKAQAKKCLSG
jgi:hypothetical protein